MVFLQAGQLCWTCFHLRRHPSWKKAAQEHDDALRSLSSCRQIRQLLTSSLGFTSLTKENKFKKEELTNEKSPSLGCPLTSHIPDLIMFSCKTNWLPAETITLKQDVSVL